MSPTFANWISGVTRCKPRNAQLRFSVFQSMRGASQTADCLHHVARHLKVYSSYNCVYHMSSIFPCLILTSLFVPQTEFLVEGGYTLTKQPQYKNKTVRAPSEPLV